MKKTIKIINPGKPKKRKIGRVAKKVHLRQYGSTAVYKHRPVYYSDDSDKLGWRGEQKVLNPKTKTKRRKKNPLLIQSPFRRIKKATSFQATKNPKRKKKISETISQIKKKGTQMAAIANPKRRHHRRKANPAVVANKSHRRHHVRRHSNPGTVGGGVNFSKEGIMAIAMDGLMVGGGMLATNWLSNFINSKWLNIENKWLRYLLMLGVGVGGGWAIGKANSRVGKNFAVGAAALTIWTIANENLDFLKRQKLQVLKGYDDEDALLGNMTLGELIEARDLSRDIISQNNAELSGSLVDTMEGSGGAVQEPFYGENQFDYMAGAGDFPQQGAYNY